MMVTLGKASLTLFWISSAWASGIRFTVPRKVLGASSKAPGWKSTKKLGWNEAQRTWRRLVMRPSTSTPCTSKRQHVSRA